MNDGKVKEFDLGGYRSQALRGFSIPYRKGKKRTLHDLLVKLKMKVKVHVYGASTKGTILQWLLRN
jgi:hypothetical protein